MANAKSSPLDQTAEASAKNAAEPPLSPSHTPGPWRFRLWAMSDEDVQEAKRLGLDPVRALDNDGSATVIAGSEEDSHAIAKIIRQAQAKRSEGYRTPCPERDANARLVALAPDMLEALKDIVHYKQIRSGDFGKITDYAVPVEIIDKIRLLIARAGAP